MTGSVVDPPASTTEELLKRRLMFPATEVCEMLGMSRRTLRRLEITGQVRMVRIGHKGYVTAAELQRFVGNLDAAAYQRHNGR